ncbi:MAG: FAD-dependent monooxygenase [Phycisphaerales bacterium]
MIRTAIIVGDGLAGALMAVLLARDGWRVRVFERRPDPRATGYVGGRSINLALSARGLAGLAAGGLEARVRERDIIPMPGRMIHARDGTLTFQPYSKDPREAINSVSRGGLNLTLIEAAAGCAGVELVFDHLCVDVDLGAPAVVFRRSDGSIVRAGGDLVIGADGAFSAVRGVMRKTDRFEYSQTYLEHGYKELHIPAMGGGTKGRRDERTKAKQDAVAAEPVACAPGSLERERFAMEPHALHIWPRGGAMMIALPNRDGSFTCTLFWPFEGEHSFAGLRTGAEVEAFFREHYADAVPLMPTLAEDFVRNPASSLVTVRCRPWRWEGKVVLVGDAAHAIVPFYGQGINCGFEDCVELAARLREHADPAEALAAYEAARKPNADAIAEMAIENFVEMRDKAGRPEFLYRKKVEQTIHGLFPDRWTPQYNLVSFSTVPYVEARRRGRELDAVIDAVVAEVPMGSVEAMGEERWRRAIEEVVHHRGTEGTEKREDWAEDRKGRTGEESRRGVWAEESREGAVIDISPALTSGINVWPGDTPMTREVLCDLERGANITLSTLRTTVHVGSHADGPNHYGKGAAGVGEMPLRHYLGPCHVVEAAVARGGRVRPEDICGGLGAIRHSRVLIRTGTFPDVRRWNADFAGLSVELVDALAARGVITIGIDTPSVDVQESKDLPAHHAILRHGIAILEGLVLAGVEAGEYELIALPLRLMEFDASPVRAVLRRIG